MPSRLFYINKGPSRVCQTIALKQNGRCRCCGAKFNPNEQIVSNGKRKKYYHMQCAQRLNILPTLNGEGPKPNIIIDSLDSRPTLLVSPKQQKIGLKKDFE